MAYKPSFRRKASSLEMDLDIKPVMNLMVVLIPLLLSGAELLKLSVIEINLPPTATGGGGSGDQTPVQEKQKTLGLKIVITKTGFSLATASTIMAGEASGGPTIPVKADGTFDYSELKKKLIELKKLIVNQGYKDKDTAVITASADIEYQMIVDVLDVIQQYKDDEGNMQPLFPVVNFGQVVI
jgi:biopolymer transport protein TolR